jgi:hypothetical protein
MTNHNKLIEVLPPKGSLLKPIMQIDNLSNCSKNILIMQAVRMDSKDFRKFLDSVYAARHKIISSNFTGMFYRLKLLNDICNNALLTTSDKTSTTTVLDRFFDISSSAAEVIDKTKQIILKSLPENTYDDQSTKELESILSSPPSHQWRYNPKSYLSVIEQDEWIFENNNTAEIDAHLLDVKKKAIDYINKNEISPVFFVVVIYIAVNTKPEVFRRFLDKVCRVYTQEYHGLFRTLISINDIVNSNSYDIFEKHAFVNSIDTSTSILLEDFDVEDINENFWIELTNIIVQTPKPNWRSKVSLDIEKEVPPPAKSGKYTNADEFKSLNLEHDIKIAKQHSNYNEAILTAINTIYNDVQEGEDLIVNSLKESMKVCDPHVAFAAVVEAVSNIYIKSQTSKPSHGYAIRAISIIQSSVSEYIRKNNTFSEINIHST